METFDDACPPLVLGLEYLMRKMFEDQDLTSTWDDLLARAQADASDAAALMDLSTMLYLTNRAEEAAHVQALAVAQSAFFRVRRSAGRSLRVLGVVTQGDLMANTPLDLLLANADVELTLCFVGYDGMPTAGLPEHDLVFQCIGESSDNSAALRALEPHLMSWPRPVVNGQTDLIASLTRDGVCAICANAQALVFPRAVRTSRDALASSARPGGSLASIDQDLSYPIIIRPVGTHAGKGMSKVEDAISLKEAISDQLDHLFYAMPFIDYSGNDGFYRKQRIVLVDGRPLPAHMAISENWMVHYLNAGMDLSHSKRLEEKRFLSDFDDDFGVRYEKSFKELYEAFGLDYFGIDCAGLPDGRLLVFEVDVAMIVHDLDPSDLYPYKKPAMNRLMAALESFLFRHSGRVRAASPHAIATC